MKSLFEKESAEEIKIRFNNLEPNAEPVWGKMSASQMMAHSSAAMETALGKKNPPRMFIGRILGGLLKSQFYNDKLYGKNSPTDPSFIIKNPGDFEEERNKLFGLIDEFRSGGEDNVTTQPHSFFGKLTPEQWAKGMYKHLDHHLRQFGL